MRRGPVSRNKDDRADFVARLEWGVSPFIAGWGKGAEVFVTAGEECENVNGPGGAGNTTRSLTRDLPQQEGAGSW